VTFILLATGWWLLAGEEGHPSVLARVTGVADVGLHKVFGWGLALLAIAPVAYSARAVRTFLRNTFRADPGDGRWLARWPRAVFTGRFGRHEGHFDPGQRVANVLIVGGLIAMIVSGIGLVLVHGGSSFVWFLKIHKYATYGLTIVLAGHIIVGAGLLPGYRGVWRSIHWNGQLDADVARRLWPGWAERKAPTEIRTRRTD
jgi:formate dehydrogenase subunit gamma